ncbi:MAG: phage holin family protein [Bacteroidota bacterium]|nr:phage holin family protein [Bacteroidota bacterium]MDP4212035.1 phage holin family protein [Bacteroidota bacterium]MDP4249602.1 phage holin family protein [Bacteroidota bacterium]
MPDSEISLKSLIEKSQDYLETKLEIAKLKTVEKSSDVLSSIVVLISMIFLALLCFMFISIGLAFYLGSLVGSAHTGFFIMGGVYGIILIILYLLRNKWIKTPVSNLVIKKILK